MQAVITNPVVTTTIVKLGNSQGIRLPKPLLESTDMAINDTVDITAEQNMIIIRKVKPIRIHKTLKERIEGYDTSIWPDGEEWDTGHPVGDEIF